MSVFYRLLGLVAQANIRMGRFSVNFIPSNWLVIVVMGIFFAVCLQQTQEGLINDRAPKAMSLNEVLDRDDLAGRYVAVTGALIPKAALLYGETKHGVETIEFSYVPMLNRRERLLLVKYSGDVSQMPSEMTTVTGMLRRPAPNLKRKLGETGGRLGRFPVDLDYVLEQGRTPGDLALAATGTGVLGVTLLLFAIVLGKRNLIFQRTPPDVVAPPDPASALVPDEGVDLRISGRLRLNEKASQRFIEMSGALGRLDSGDLVLVSNIDASKRFMGTLTENRSGYWVLRIPPDTLHDPELGRIYLGFSARPALRLLFTHPETQKLATAVLSCADDAQRNMIVLELSRLCGRTLTPI